MDFLNDKDGNNITLTDLFEVEMLQRIQDSFSRTMGMAALITDAKGNPITKGTNFTDFCMNHVRTSPIGCLRCMQCDSYGAEKALKEGKPVTYSCHAGLTDFAAPIMAGDKLVGCFVGGQVLTTPPNIPTLMQVSDELQMDMIDFLQSAMSVPIVTEEKLNNAADFLYTITDSISSIAYHKYIILQASLEVEHAANMKTDFLANMSHEIRTPMNAVIGMTEMALREDLTPTARNYIAQIKTSGQTLLTIINDILDFSKIESGKMNIIEADYEPASIINDVANIINTRIDADNVEFIVDMAPTLPMHLCGDSIRIKQLITNISNNAAKFTKQGSVKLTVSYEPIDEDFIMLEVHVKDTGIGIKEEDKPKLFGAFSQVDTKRNRNVEGTGLGLAICKQLLILMDGEIDFTSEYGKGSDFFFKVPQKVVDWTPSVSINDKKISIYGYLENRYLNNQLAKDIEKLGYTFKRVSKLEKRAEVMESTKTSETFLFIEQKNFTPKLQKLALEAPEVTVTVLIPYNTSAVYDIPNVRVIKKPLFAVNLAAILNNSDLFMSSDAVATNDFDFTAPDAQILIVDDNSVNLTVAMGLLEPLNMHIDTAISGQDALQMITYKHYDMILMDHMMPGLDGVKTTRVIRQFHPDYATVPIIALSANAVSEAKEMFLSEGMDDFIAKPIELRTMVPIIKKWLPPEKIISGNIPNAAKKAKPTDIPNIKNLDTKLAFSLLGSENLFWRVLKDYYRSIEGKYKLIREAYDKGDLTNYSIYVHAMKSSSKQIGAMALSELSLEMEMASKAGNIDLVKEKTDELLRMYWEYKDILAPYFPEEEVTPTDAPPASLQKMNDAFDHMSAAIEELDIDAMENALNELSIYHFEGEEKELLQQMYEACDNIDVEKIEEIMIKWKELLKG